jgi:hypothetical protein
MIQHNLNCVFAEQLREKIVLNWCNTGASSFILLYTWVKTHQIAFSTQTYRFEQYQL